MGAGKSSIGQLLAHQLHLRYVDTDHWIEHQIGKPIARIFAEEGEPYFRTCETELVKELATQQGLIVATGGGLGADPQHLQSLKTHCLVVWLWASAEVLWERVRHQTHRPLLQTPDPLGRIRELLAQREPVYRLADLLVNTEMRSSREIVHQIVHEYDAARRATG
jgi:shikimate kinase